MNSASAWRIVALATRIIRQFARDRRTLLLLFISPLVVMSLMYYLLEGPPSKIPFALVKKSAGTSIVYDIVKNELGEDERISLVEVAESDIEKSLREGVIRGAMVVAGGGIGDMSEGRGVELEVFMEGSDALASKELAAILARLSKNLLPAVRDVVNVMGSDTDIAMASMEIKHKYLYGGPDFSYTDYFAPIILGVFPFVLTFLLTSVSFLRERSSGTMERLLASPIGRIEVIAGYMFGFLIFTMIQTGIILAFVLLVLKVHQVGSLLLLFAVVTVITVVASGLGMFLSSFARTELQVAQFMPLVILPLILISGVIWPVETMPKWLLPVSYASPLTWAVFALRDVMIKGLGPAGIAVPVGMMLAFAAAFVFLAAATLKRQLD